MSDLIDRQATLKHIENIRKGVQMMDDTHRASIIMNGMHLCEEAVRNQPSAEPEVVRCKDCKHRYGKACDFADFWLKDDDYCSRAERRTDAEIH